LDVNRSWLKYYLKLRVLIEAVRIFAIPSVGWPAARLNIGYAIGFPPDHPKEGLRVHGARAYFYVVRLLQQASAFNPKILQPP
jgi:hypothetical protein